GEVSLPTGDPLAGVAPAGAVAAILDGREVDLAYCPESDADVRFLTPADAGGLHVFRHSSAHLLAAAVKDLFPEARYGIGPPIEGGFYYDFRVEEPFSREDLDRIEVRMRELVKQRIPFEREILDKDDAIRVFEEQGEFFKVELVREKGDARVSCYRVGDFFDFCEGPHVPHTGVIRALKVLSSSNAYWKGDSSGIPMQRIYATSFTDRKEMAAHLARLEEAKRRDHRRIGRDQRLFLILPEAPGQVFWLPAGMGVVNRLLDSMREKLERRSYQEIRTPLILNESVWARSGHLDHYRDNMFFIESDENRFGIKPMNCPGAALVYRSDIRSYRDLPLRLSEFGHCHRFEPSGVLSGLTRVRAFTQDDAHVYCRLDQVRAEVVALVDLVKEVYGEFGFEDIQIEVSTRPEKSVGTTESWEQAEVALVEALTESGDAWSVNSGDGAFYGPKIDFHVRDALRRSHQCATIQLDFSQAPAFDLYYATEDGGRERPVVIHRAILGSVERFFALLLEHTAGALPVWIAPVQAMLIPIADRHQAAAAEVADALRAEGFRIAVDDRREKMGYKIREAEVARVPFMVVLGDREVEEDTLAVRTRGKRGQEILTTAALADRLGELTKNRSLTP
ncbi:Threonine--tRNA ligase, partial [Geodia barretti]